MITANEARKIALEEDEKIVKQFANIESHIYETALNGLFSVTIVGEIHPYVKIYLEQIGYSVAILDDFYTISWVQ